MSDWEVDLVPDDNPLAETAPASAVIIAPQKHALGTFAVSGNRIQISYVPALLQRPDRLIATFAHELGPLPARDDDRNAAMRRRRNRISH
jgi:hypothetical protein